MKPVKRIIIAATFDPTIPGGGSQYSVDLARIWLQNGHEVHVLCSNYKRNLLDLDSYAENGMLRIHELTDYNKIMLSHVFDVALYELATRLIGDISPESIHVHNFHGLIGAIWAAVESNAKTFYTALDFGMICHTWYLYDGSTTPCTGPEPAKCEVCLTENHHLSKFTSILTKIPPPIANKLIHLARLFNKDPAYYRQCTLIRAYSENIAEHLHKMIPLLPRFSAILTISPITGKVLSQYGVRRDRIFYNVQGVHPVDPSELNSSNVPETGVHEIKLVYLGTFAQIKGFTFLINVLERLPDGLKLKIYLYGATSKFMMKTYSSKARRYLCASDLLVEKEVEQELLSADSLIIPSLWHENTPYAVLRSLAVGRPVISSDQEGISHLIRDHVNGLLISPGDASAWESVLLDIDKNPALLKDMRQNCHFDKTVENYAAEIEDIIMKTCAR
ncbi:MAG: glycosyltransferase family 4 protein [Geobacteraceae bacterium]|nr:glycosyltransferase family 4 protein [Geobacteraceae bacterium]NTW79526.1 glycosyltransferase family 4 protein [Geobacteraceae bacterium]